MNQEIQNKVSILVVMDDALVQITPVIDLRDCERLNPCCDGRCSSTTISSIEEGFEVGVSILVVMDDALVLTEEEIKAVVQAVSILVVMDDALVPNDATVGVGESIGLNPCCDGRCSSTRETETILIINMLQNYTKVIFAFLNQKLTVS